MNKLDPHGIEVIKGNNVIFLLYVRELCIYSEHSDKFYFTTIVPQRPDTNATHYFTVEDELTYEPFFADFGPLNLGHVYSYCRFLDQKIKVLVTCLVIGWMRLDCKCLFYFIYRMKVLPIRKFFIIQAWMVPNVLMPYF